jgi:hypothetical protein
MELRDVIKDGVISIGGHVYQRRDHQGSVVNMELIYPAPKQQVIHRYPEATAVKPPSRDLLQRLSQVATPAQSSLQSPGM